MTPKVCSRGSIAGFFLLYSSESAESDRRKLFSLLICISRACIVPSVRSLYVKMALNITVAIAQTANTQTSAAVNALLFIIPADSNRSPLLVQFHFQFLCRLTLKSVLDFERVAAHCTWS